MRELSRPVARGSRGVNAKARARYHDLQLGRFRPINPVGYADQMKRYVLVYNDSVSLVDQSATQAHDRRTSCIEATGYSRSASDGGPIREHGRRSSVGKQLIGLIFDSIGTKGCD